MKKIEGKSMTKKEMKRVIKSLREENERLIKYSLENVKEDFVSDMLAADDMQDLEQNIDYLNNEVKKLREERYSKMVDDDRRGREAFKNREQR